MSAMTSTAERTLRGGRKPWMRRNALWPAARQWAVTLAFLCAGAGLAATAEHLRPGADICAANDREAASLVERHYRARDIADARLSEAFVAVQRARHRCAEGRIAEAVALYDGVLRGPAGVAREAVGQASH
jgi:hypothetical protein